jgi:hypothetical protein
MISPLALTEAIRSLGVCDVLAGNPLVAASLLPLGITEGEITPSVPMEMNKLTTESTGGAPHAATVTVGEPTVTFNLVMGDPDLWAQVSPTGTASAGWSMPQNVVYTSLLLIPQEEMAGGLAYDGTTWTRTAGRNYAGASGAGAAPANALWFWKVVMSGDMGAFRRAEGGKVVGSVTAHAFMDFTKPEGQMLFTRGNPVAAGVTGVRL